MQKSLQDRTDNLYVSKGDVRIHEIRGAVTRKNGSGIYLPSGKLHWSHSHPGKSGYYYFGRAAEGTTWEFAASDQADIQAFHGRPVKATFYGEFSPSRDLRLGQSAANAINVEVGQVVLARTVQNPTTIYIIKIETQGEEETVTVQYAVLDSK